MLRGSWSGPVARGPHQLGTGEPSTRTSYTMPTDGATGMVRRSTPRLTMESSSWKAPDEMATGPEVLDPYRSIR